MKIQSRITGENFNPEQTVAVTNLVQGVAYIENDILPKDIYLTRMNEDEKVRMVFLFDKKESSEAYRKWRNHELDYTVREYETDKVGN